jgi:hypothetical protein
MRFQFGKETSSLAAVISEDGTCVDVSTQGVLRPRIDGLGEGDHLLLEQYNTIYF